MSSPLLYLDAPGPEAALFSEREQDVLALVNRKVAAGESLDAVMNFLFDATREVCPCERIGLAFVEDDGRRVTARWARATYEPLMLAAGYSEELAVGSLAEVISSRRPRIINDLEAYLAEHPDSTSTALLVREGVRSSMTCPLEVDGRPAGLLFRNSRRVGGYDAHQVALHLAIAERLAQAVEKAWRIDQLATANGSYMEMLGFVAHELKSPMAAVVMDAKVLLGGYVGELNERQRDTVERMVRKATMLINLVRDYLDLARLEGGELALRSVAEVDVVSTVVETALDLLRPQIEERRVRLERDLPAGPVMAECDAELLQIVLVNLLGNAVKYGNVDGLVRLRLRRLPDALAVSVWNEGPGFPDSERGRLFKKFSRLQTRDLLSRKGSGVGLYTSWRIVRLHGGHIEAHSQPGAWAEFSVTIPQPLPKA